MPSISITLRLHCAIVMLYIWSRKHVFSLYENGLSEISTRQLKKLRKFSTGFLRHKKVDRLVQVFTQPRDPFSLICIDFIRPSMYFSVIFVWCPSLYVRKSYGSLSAEIMQKLVKFKPLF